MAKGDVARKYYVQHPLFSVSMMMALVIGDKLLAWLDDQPAGDYDETE